MADIIQIRRDTAANWTAEDPVLAHGEMGWETDTGKVKFGNGVDPWTSLDYFAGEGGGSGDVVGPASSTDSHVALFDGVTGKLLKDGGALGTAAFDDVGDFATSAQGALAESAVQPGDLGTMAAEDDAPSDGSLYGRKNGEWEGIAPWVEITQAAYDALDPPDPNTLYVIVG